MDTVIFKFCFKYNYALNGPAPALKQMMSAERTGMPMGARVSGNRWMTGVWGSPCPLTSLMN